MGFLFGKWDEWVERVESAFTDSGEFRSIVQRIDFELLQAPGVCGWRGACLNEEGPQMEFKEVCMSGD